MKRILSAAIALCMAFTLTAPALATDTGTPPEEQPAQTLQERVNAASDNSTIDLGGKTETLSATLTVNKSLTFTNGTITVAEGFSQDSRMIDVVGGNVTFDGVNLDAGNVAKYAVQFFSTNGSVTGTLKNGTVSNGRFTNVLVNGASLTVENVTFSGGGYGGGIELAQGENVTALPHVTLTGSNTPNNNLPLVYVDDSQITAQEATGGYGALVTPPEGGDSTAQLWMDDAAFLSNVIAAAPEGSTIDLAGQAVSVDSTLNIGKALTLQNGTVIASENFAVKSDNLVTVTAPGVKLSGMTLDGNSRAKYGVHFYAVNSGTLTGGTVQNNLYNGVQVNGSSVTIDGVAFTGNGGENTDRGGIELGIGTGVSTVPQVVLQGELSSDHPANLVQIDSNQVTTDVLDKASLTVADLINDEASSIKVEATTDENGNIVVKIPVEKVEIAPGSMAFTLGENVTLTGTFEATVTPDTATVQTVSWAITSGEGVVELTDNGNNTATVTALAEGEATITATADGQTATCTVSVAAAQEPENPDSDSTPDAGSDSTPGAGSDSTPGAGSDSTPGAGSDSTPGAGSNSTPDAGSDSTPDAGSDSTTEPEPSDPVEAFVTRLYETCLDRTPDAEGLADWVDVLKSGREGGAKVVYGFVFSPEFQNRNYSNEEFLKHLYRAFMGREYDAEGLADWLGVMAEGGTREEIFEGFAYSREFTNICARYGINR